MIEAIIICVALDTVMQSCSRWEYKEPATSEQVLEECASIVEEMAAKGFEVTCEEDPNE